MAANSEVDMSTPFEREPLGDAARPERGLEEVIEVLREDVEPSAAWRDQLLQQLAIGVRFAVMAAGAARVSLVGDFNGWDPDATPLRLASDGRTWVAMLPMREGRHTYAFVIDGEVVADPSAPRAADDDFGTPSSLMLVSNAR